MTDDIKVGDRFPVVGVARHFNSSNGTWAIEFGTGARSWFMSIPVDTLAEYERLPPEIGVGDEVRVTATTSKIGFGEVLHIYGDLAWVKWNTGGSALRFLSDLTLIKKAEKD